MHQSLASTIITFRGKLRWPLPTIQTDRRKKRKQAYINLDNLAHARPGRSQNSLEVIAASLGLIGNGTLDQRAGGVGGDLAGDEELAVCADGLGLISLY